MRPRCCLGHGKTLCNLLLNHATQVLGAPSVKLRVYRNNLPANAFYRALGFEANESEANTEVLAKRVATQGASQVPS